MINFNEDKKKFSEFMFLVRLIKKEAKNKGVEITSGQAKRQAKARLGLGNQKREKSVFKEALRIEKQR